ncbi:MAG: pyruvoyl-dependent arginine decarboxylase [Candidatus Heimdallarchaeaceae archaeon]
MVIPKRYWLTAGVGESNFSPLVAADKAFIQAGIGYQNHVLVSSIPPVKEVKVKIDSKLGLTSIVEQDGSSHLIVPSTILHVVRAMKIAQKGEKISACIALCKVNLTFQNKTYSCLLAYENTGHDLKETKEEALAGVKNLVQSRNVKIDVTWGENGFKVISSSLTVQKKFGCVASFVVFDPTV